MKSGVVCIFCTLLSAVTEARNTPDPSCPSNTLAALELSVGEQVLVPVRYQGETVSMVLDVAKPFSLIRPQAVDVFRLPAQKLEPRSGLSVKIAGRPVISMAHVDSLRVGDYRIARQDFFVDPTSHPQVDSDRVVLGSLGMGDLWPVDFELNLAARKLTVYSAGQCRGAPTGWSSVPVEVNEMGNVYLPVELDGSRMEAGLSTTSATLMSVDVARKLFGLDEHSPGISVQQDREGRTHSTFKATKLTIGGLTLTNVTVHLTDAAKSCTLSNTGVFGDVLEFKGRDDYLCYAAYPLVIGIPELAQLRLYFALRGKSLYLSSSAQAP